MQKAILKARQRAPRDYVHFATNGSDKRSAPCSVFEDRGQLRIGFKTKGFFSDSLESFLSQNFMRNGVFTLPRDKTPNPKQFTRGNPVSKKDSQRFQEQHAASVRNNFAPSVLQPANAAASSTYQHQNHQTSRLEQGNPVSKKNSQSLQEQDAASMRNNSPPSVPKSANKNAAASCMFYRQNTQQLRDESPEASFSQMLAPYRTMGRTFFCGTKVPEHIAKISKILAQNRLTEADKITQIGAIASDALRKNPLLRDSQLQAFYEKLRDAGNHCSTFKELIDTINQPEQQLSTRRGSGRP